LGIGKEQAISTVKPKKCKVCPLRLCGSEGRTAELFAKPNKELLRTNKM
jgi:hypothetical protein